MHGPVRVPQPAQAPGSRWTARMRRRRQARLPQRLGDGGNALGYIRGPDRRIGDRPIGTGRRIGSSWRTGDRRIGDRRHDDPARGHRQVHLRLRRRSRRAGAYVLLPQRHLPRMHRGNPAGDGRTGAPDEAGVLPEGELPPRLPGPRHRPERGRRLRPPAPHAQDPDRYRRERHAARPHGHPAGR